MFASLSFGDFSLEGGFVKRKKEIPTAAYETVFNYDNTKTADSRVFTDFKYQHEFANQLGFKACLYLPYNFHFDASVDYVSRLPNIDVPAHTRFDLRLGYQPIKSLELSLGVQNIFGPPHREFNSNFMRLAKKIERSIYGKFTWSV